MKRLILAILLALFLPAVARAQSTYTVNIQNTLRWQPGTSYTGRASGGGLSCPTNFTLTNASCVWEQTAVSGSTSTLIWTGLTGDAYSLECDGIIPVASTSSFGVRFGESAGPTWKSGATDYNNVYVSAGGNNFPTGGKGAGSYIFAGNNVQNTGTAGESYGASFTNLQNTTATKAVKWHSASNWSTQDGFGYMNADTNEITAIQFGDMAATPTTFSGVCRLIARY